MCSKLITTTFKDVFCSLKTIIFAFNFNVKKKEVKVCFYSNYKTAKLFKKPIFYLLIFLLFKPGSCISDIIRFFFSFNLHLLLRVASFFYMNGVIKKPVLLPHLPPPRNTKRTKFNINWSLSVTYYFILQPQKVKKQPSSSCYRIQLQLLFYGFSNGLQF